MTRSIRGPLVAAFIAGTALIAVAQVNANEKPDPQPAGPTTLFPIPHLYHRQPIATLRSDDGRRD